MQILTDIRALSGLAFQVPHAGRIALAAVVLIAVAGIGAWGWRASRPMRFMRALTGEFEPRFWRYFKEHQDTLKKPWIAQDYAARKAFDEAWALVASSPGNQPVLRSQALRRLWDHSCYMVGDHLSEKSQANQTR